MAPFRAIYFLVPFTVILAACQTGTTPPHQLGPVGGPGGNAFDEYTEIPANTELVAIHAPIEDDICGYPNTPLVHYIQSSYSPPRGYWGRKHGDGLVCIGTFTVPGLPTYLDQDEFLTGIYGSAAALVTYIRPVTSKSQYSSFDEIEQYANKRATEYGGNPFFLFAPPGYKVTRWFGRSGTALDAIGIRTEEESALPKTGFSWYKLGAVGGWGGAGFEDGPVGNDIRVTKIVVYVNCVVRRVDFEYSNGQIEQHGDLSFFSQCPGYHERPFTLESDEFIKGIRGRAGTFIDRIEIVTNKRTLDPGGGSGGHPFNLVAADGYQVRRLFGRAGAALDSVGIIAERRFRPSSAPWWRSLL